MGPNDSIAVNAKRLGERQKRNAEKRTRSQHSLRTSESDKAKELGTAHDYPSAPNDNVRPHAQTANIPQHGAVEIPDPNQRRRLFKPSIDFNFSRLTPDKLASSTARRQRTSESAKQPPVSLTSKYTKRNSSLPPPTITTSNDDDQPRRTSDDSNIPIPYRYEPTPPPDTVIPDCDSFSTHSSQTPWEEVSDVMNDGMISPPSGGRSGRITCQCVSHSGHKILDEKYACSAADVAAAIFGDGGSGMMEEIAEKAGIYDVTYDRWTVKEDGGWVCRCISYDIRFKAPLTGELTTSCIEVQQVFQQDANVLVVESTIETPRLPYGTHFLTKLRFCITPAGSRGCRLRIHSRVEYLRRIMMQDSITKTTLEHLHRWVRDLDAQLLDMAADACGLPRVWRASASRKTVTNKSQHQHRGRALKRRESSYELFQRDEEAEEDVPKKGKAVEVEEFVARVRPSLVDTPRSSSGVRAVKSEAVLAPRRTEAKGGATQAAYVSPPASPPRRRRKPLGPRPLSPPGSPPASPPRLPTAAVAPPPLKLDDAIRMPIRTRASSPVLRGPQKQPPPSRANDDDGTATTSTDRSTPETTSTAESKKTDPPREAISSVVTPPAALVASQTPGKPAGAAVWTANGWTQTPAPEPTPKPASNHRPERTERVLRRSGGAIAKWVDGQYVVTQAPAPVTRITTTALNTQPSTSTAITVPTPLSPKLPPWHAARRRLDQHLALQRHDWALPGRFRAIESSPEPTTPSSATTPISIKEDIIYEDIPPAFRLRSLLFHVLLVVIHVMDVNPVTFVMTLLTTMYHLFLYILPSSFSTSAPPTATEVIIEQTTSTQTSPYVNAQSWNFFSLPTLGFGVSDDVGADAAGETCGELGSGASMSKAAIAWWVASKVAGSVVGSVGWIVVAAAGKVLAGRVGGKQYKGMLTGALGEALNGGT